MAGFLDYIQGMDEWAVVISLAISTAFGSLLA